MGNPVKWGVISTADIGLKKVLPAMKQGQMTSLEAIASRDPDRARAAADALGIPKSYGTYEELLADADIEAVYIPVPNHLHVALTEQAAAAGKHVLCEKPVALTADEASRLIVARDRHGVLIQEAFMVRSHPQWLKARELVREGAIGKLLAVQGFFSYFNDDPNNVRNMADIGGGALYDIGCYPINTSRFLFETEPDRVIGLIERDPAFKTDRLCSALMEFPGGHAQFTVSTQMVPYQRMQVFGSEGRIEIEIPFNAPPDAPTRIFLDDGSGLGEESRREIQFDIVDQYTVQGDLFSQAIRGDRSQVLPLEDTVANMRVIDAVFRSEQSGNWEVP